MFIHLFEKPDIYPASTTLAPFCDLSKHLPMSNCSVHTVHAKFELQNSQHSLTVFTLSLYKIVCSTKLELTTMLEQWNKPLLIRYIKY